MWFVQLLYHVRHNRILCEISARLVSFANHIQPFEKSFLIIFMPCRRLAKGIKIARPKMSYTIRGSIPGELRD